LVKFRHLQLLFLASCFGAQAHGFAGRPGLDELHSSLKPGDSNSLFYPIAAAAIVVGALSLRHLQALLSAPPFLFLRKISFALYLIYVPLLYTFAASAALVFNTVFPAGLSLAALVGVPFLTLSTALAVLFEYLVDQPLLRCLRRLKPHPINKLELQQGEWDRPSASLGRFDK
jgi:peptidoglycan/LPS O-acetylase OafA/YrhL